MATPRSPGSFLSPAGAVVAVVFVGGGDFVGGREGCWPCRGKGSGFWANMDAGTVSRTALSRKRETLPPSMILLSHRNGSCWQYFSHAALFADTLRRTDGNLEDAKNRRIEESRQSKTRGQEPGSSNLRQSRGLV